MAIFGPKPSVIPFGKMSIFGLLKLLVFIPQKGVFSFQNIVKDIFLAYIAFKKKLEKWPLLNQKKGLTPLEKYQFLEFLNCCFYSLKRRLFVLKYLKRHFPGLYCLKKKVGKMAIFGPKPWVHPFGKMSIFELFDLLVFLA